MIEVVPLEEIHRPAWQRLVNCRITPSRSTTSHDEYAQAWSRLLVGHEVHGLAAIRDGELVGVAHYLFHASAWTPRVCWVQDLVTAPHARGHGVARRLIHRVAELAQAAGASRYYWHTHEDSAQTRVPHQRVDRLNRFIRYDYPLKLDA